MSCSPSPFFGERYDSSNSQLQFMADGNHHPFRVRPIVNRGSTSIRNHNSSHFDAVSDRYPSLSYRYTNNHAPSINNIDIYPTDSATHSGYYFRLYR